MKTFSILFILFSLLVELTDPSTNFIRAGIGKSPVAGQESSGTDSLQDASVCYATEARDYEFQIIIVTDTHFNRVRQDYVDAYYPSIFQPPKRS